MGMFASIDKAKVSGGGVYFLPGKYVVEIERCFTLKSRKNAHLAIVECLIKESDNPARSAGTRASWVSNLDGQDAAMGNIKAFLAIANGLDTTDEKLIDENVDEAMAAYCFGESNENPLAGYTMSLQCTTVKTRAGNDFTKHMWSLISAA